MFFDYIEEGEKNSSFGRGSEMGLYEFEPWNANALAQRYFDAGRYPLISRHFAQHSLVIHGSFILAAGRQNLSGRRAVHKQGRESVPGECGVEWEGGKWWVS